MQKGTATASWLPKAINLSAIALCLSGREEDGIQQLLDGLKLNPESTMLLSMLAELYLTAERVNEAEEVMTRALSFSPDHVTSNFVMGKVLIALKRNAEAEVILRRTLLLQQSRNQDHLATYQSLSEAIMPGAHYQQRLSDFHQWLKPACYLEIGVATGATIKLARPNTIAIGIDPNPVINMPLPKTTQVFSLESDAFFEKYNLSVVTGHTSLDFAFIDGLHQFDQVLRDFINVEKCCRADSVVVLHDCLPLDKVSSESNRTTKFWSGDPWKVMAVLQKYRPDLTCFTIPTRPTGLGVVSKLDPNNRVLEDNMDEILATYQNCNYDWLLQQGLKETLGVFVNDWRQIMDRLSKAKSPPRVAPKRPHEKVLPIS